MRSSNLPLPIIPNSTLPLLFTLMSPRSCKIAVKRLPLHYTTPTFPYLTPTGSYCGICNYNNEIQKYYNFIILYHDAWAFPLMWSGVLIAKLPHYIFMGCITFFPRCITDSVIHLVSIILSLMSRNEISR